MRVMEKGGRGRACGARVHGRGRGHLAVRARGGGGDLRDPRPRAGCLRRGRETYPPNRWRGNPRFVMTNRRFFRLSGPESPFRHDQSEIGIAPLSGWGRAAERVGCGAMHAAHERSPAVRLGRAGGEGVQRAGRVRGRGAAAGANVGARERCPAVWVGALGGRGRAARQESARQRGAAARDLSPPRRPVGAGGPGRAACWEGARQRGGCGGAAEGADERHAGDGGLPRAGRASAVRALCPPTGAMS